jgi:hypothetical protein
MKTIRFLVVVTRARDILFHLREAVSHVEILWQISSGNIVWAGVNEKQ